MDETKPTDQLLDKTKKIPSVFRKTILQPQTMDVTKPESLHKTIYHPQDMIESDEDVFQDAECDLEEKSNFKSIYVADMDLCSPTEIQREEKSSENPKSLKNRRTIQMTEEMEIMSPVLNFSQDTSTEICMLENLVNDGRHSREIARNIPEIIEPINVTRMSLLTMQEMAINYCKENNITDSTRFDSNSILMKLTDPNITRRSIVSVYETSPDTKSRKRVSMNITVEKNHDEPSNIHKTKYSTSPMSITSAVSPRASHNTSNESKQVTDKHKTIILEETMNLSENSSEIISGNSKRKTTHVHESMNFTGLLNESAVSPKTNQMSHIKTISTADEKEKQIVDHNTSVCMDETGNSKRKTTHAHESMNFTGLLNQTRKSCINLQRKTIYDHEEMNMTEIKGLEPEVTERSMINEGNYIFLLNLKKKIV